MLCRRVQVERPSSSTSGGQSGGISVGWGVEWEVVAGVGIVEGDDDEVEAVEEEGEVCDCCFVRARHEAIDVQVRQLRRTS
jgi:hypothetical protein